MSGFIPLTPAQIAKLTADILAINQYVASVYAIVLAGAITLFTIGHWMKWFSRSNNIKFLAGPSRMVQSLALINLKFFTSMGHATMLAIYLMVNIILASAPTHMNFAKPWSLFAQRCGWMAVLNLALTFFLALKNTPLQFLVGLSYDKLNVLHQWTGRTTFCFVIIHVSVTVAEYYAIFQIDYLTEIHVIHGQIAAASLTLLTVLSISAVRKRFYELFYKVHVILYLLIIVNLVMHQPNVNVRVIGVTTTIVSILFLDRAMRTIRMVYYSIGNTVTLIPLAEASTKIVFKKQIHCRPGSHAFIWIPAIRVLESHPFTISSVQKCEFVVRSRKGFTAALHEYAVQHPNVELKAFFDGPYGAIPDFATFERVVLFAGGAGASFTFAIAMDLIKQAKGIRTKRVDFVWAVKKRSELSWFDSEVQELCKSDFVNVAIHVTEGSVAQIVPSTVPAPKVTEKDPEYGVVSNESIVSLELQTGRPDIPSIVRDAAGSSSNEDSIAIAVCGPKEMIADTRSAVSRVLHVNGPSITFHAEQFGWS